VPVTQHRAERIERCADLGFLGGVEDTTMLGVVDDFYIGMDRLKMVGDTGQRFTCLGDADGVPAVAGGATTGGAIRVDVPHAVVEPDLQCRPPGLVRFEPGPAALHLFGLTQHIRRRRGSRSCLENLPICIGRITACEA